MSKGKVVEEVVEVNEDVTGAADKKGIQISRGTLIAAVIGGIIGIVVLVSLVIGFFRVRATVRNMARDGAQLVHTVEDIRNIPDSRQYSELETYLGPVGSTTPEEDSYKATITDIYYEDCVVRPEDYYCVGGSILMIKVEFERIYDAKLGSGNLKGIEISGPHFSTWVAGGGHGNITTAVPRMDTMHMVAHLVVPGDQENLYSGDARPIRSYDELHDLQKMP
jgi:hypothetical protein